MNKLGEKFVMLPYLLISVLSRARLGSSLVKYKRNSKSRNNPGVVLGSYHFI